MKTRRFLALLLIPMLLDCSAKAFYGTPIKKLKAKVVLDPAITGVFRWKEAVRGSIDSVGRHFEQGAGVGLVVDTICLWNSAGDDSGFASDRLMRDIPRGRADVVICFSAKAEASARSMDDLTMLQFGYILVAVSERELFSGDLPETQLTHRLANYLGALKMYPHRYRKMLQDNENIAYKPGVEVFERRKTVELPMFHPGNCRIMEVIGNSPARRLEWNAAIWDTVLVTYAKIVRRYGFWKTGPKDYLVNCELNDFYQFDPYKRLSDWAAICGLDSSAALYLDSMQLVAERIVRKCQFDANRPGLICEHYRVVRRYFSQPEQDWLSAFYATAQWHRCLLHLCLGHEEKARVEFDEFIKSSMRAGPEEARFRQSFAIRKALYAKIRGDAAPDADSVAAVSDTLATEPSDDSVLVPLDSSAAKPE